MKISTGSALFLGFAAFSLSASFSSTAQAFVCTQGQCSPFYFEPRPSASRSVDPIYKEVYGKVSDSELDNYLKETTGVVPVNVGGNVYRVSERYSPASKKKLRDLWTQYFTQLGIPVQEMAYKTQHNNGEAYGHNLEAVLPGKSADSVIVIVHYDSMGPAGSETSNPGVDDDMTGMAVSLETARVLAQYRGRLQNTVRFVAADYEEWASPGLEGARVYAKYIQGLSKQQGFKLVAAVDNEQIGWNCYKDGGCGDRVKKPLGFDVFSCGGKYSYPKIGDALAETSKYFSDFRINRGCIGENSDHYAMWEIGVPAVVYSEHSPFNNPHFDQEGGDTYDKVDIDYFRRIARIGVTFAARLVGVSP